MQQDLNLFVTQLVTLYAILEPIAHLSLFLALTADFSHRERRKLAIFSLLFAFCILVFFALLGQALLHAMNISITAFQISGGLILFIFALGMIFGEEKRNVEPLDESALLAVAVYPLSTPILAGPGAILAVMLLTDNNRENFAAQWVTVGVVLAMLLLLLVVFLAGEYVTRVIGRSGANLIRRVGGIIVAAFSVEVVITAVTRWLNLPPI